MLAQLNPTEVWSLRLNPSDLYNIERVQGDNPATGGGCTYIQIPAPMVQPTLQFLGIGAVPAQGTMVPLTVRDAANPHNPAQQIEFWVKSEDQSGQTRMRIARQNRHRHSRFSGWSPVAGFPSLAAGQRTPQARVLLGTIGGLRIFLARDANGVVWGGFTTGSPSAVEAALPYAQIAWAPSDGGRWP